MPWLCQYLVVPLPWSSILVQQCQHSHNTCLLQQHLAPILSFRVPTCTPCCLGVFCPTSSMLVWPSLVFLSIWPVLLLLPCQINTSIDSAPTTCVLHCGSTSVLPTEGFLIVLHLSVRDILPYIDLCIIKCWSRHKWTISIFLLLTTLPLGHVLSISFYN